jgi:hypothetical protein
MTSTVTSWEMFTGGGYVVWGMSETSASLGGG